MTAALVGTSRLLLREDRPAMRGILMVSKNPEVTGAIVVSTRSNSVFGTRNPCVQARPIRLKSADAADFPRPGRRGADRAHGRAPRAAVAARRDERGSTESSRTFELAIAGIETREPGEGSDEQPANEENRQAERDLHCDERAHHAAHAPPSRHPPALSAVIGATCEAPSAGAIPKSAVRQRSSGPRTASEPPVHDKFERHRIIRVRPAC